MRLEQLIRLEQRLPKSFRLSWEFLIMAAIILNSGGACNKCWQ